MRASSSAARAISSSHPSDMALNGPLSGLAEVERRIGDGQRGGQIECVGAAHQHRAARGTAASI